MKHLTVWSEKIASLFVAHRFRKIRKFMRLNDKLLEQMWKFGEMAGHMAMALETLYPGIQILKA